MCPFIISQVWSSCTSKQIMNTISMLYMKIEVDIDCNVMVRCLDILDMKMTKKIHNCISYRFTAAIPTNTIP